MSDEKDNAQSEKATVESLQQQLRLGNEKLQQAAFLVL